MVLRIRIEEMKDASGEKKRTMMATLTTEIEGMKRIDAVAELDNECVLGKEITKLVTDMLAIKQKELKDKHGNAAKKYVKGQKLE